MAKAHNKIPKNKTKNVNCKYKNKISFKKVVKTIIVYKNIKITLPQTNCVKDFPAQTGPWLFEKLVCK